MNDKQSALVEQLKNFGADSGKALKIKYNYPLSCCSTFRIGGNADAAAFPENSSELIEIYRAARAAEIPVFVAGNASNTYLTTGDTAVLCFLQPECSRLVMTEKKYMLKAAQC